MSYNQYPNPGPTPQYAPQYAPDGPGYNNSGYPPPEKSPYEGDRFKPKKKINDPVFLVLFVLQVSRRFFAIWLHED